MIARRKGITLTFGDVAENFAGMEKIGTKDMYGFSETDIWSLYSKFPDKSEVYDLTRLMPVWTVQPPSALFLVIRDPFPELKDELFRVLSNDTESFDQHGYLTGVTWDSQKFQYGGVVNSHARYNLCFADLGPHVKRLPNIAEGRGTIYNTCAIPSLLGVHRKIMENVGVVLNCEGNYYFDLETTYISFHSDRERTKVVGYRLGDPFPLHFRWNNAGTPLSEHATCWLNHGDLYMMSDYARGKRIAGTKILLKHAAGTNKIIFKEKK